MNRNKLLLRIAGVCGVLSVMFLLIWLPIMVSYAPGFSYTQNWISDLAGMGFSTVARPDVTTPHTVFMFNVMLAVVGTFNTVFAIGLVNNAASTTQNGASTKRYRYAAVGVLVASISTILISLFPETAFGGVPHMVFAYVSFLLMVAAAILIGLSYRKSGIKVLGNFSIALGVMMLIGTTQFSTLRGAGELILMTGQAIWILLMSFRLLEESA